MIKLNAFFVLLEAGRLRNPAHADGRMRIISRGYPENSSITRSFIWHAHCAGEVG
jgi:hypothetical protein